MAIVLAWIPLVVALLAVAVLRQSALRAGLFACLTAIVISFSPAPFQGSVAIVTTAVVQGTLNSVGVLYVMLGGVLLYHVLRAGNALDILGRAMERAVPHRGHRVLGLVFGVSVFFESTTGFGVGIIVTAPLFLAMGVSAQRAALLALTGQCAVPWGALAVGTVLGAEMSSVSAEMLGLLAAVLGFPFVILAGMMALKLVGAGEFPAGRWTAVVLHAIVLSGALAAGSMLIGVELAGPAAGVLALLFAMLAGRSDFGRDERRGRPVGVPGALMPFVVLVGCLATVRISDGIGAWLTARSTVTVDAFNFSLALAQHPGFWLVISAAVALVSLRQPPARVPAIVAGALRQWFVAGSAVVLFLILGQLMSDTGMTGEISRSIARSAGSYALVSVVLIAGLGGFLTASNAASNALFMPLQLSTAAATGINTELAAGVQNTVGSNMTLASPGRLVFAATVAGEPGSEGALLRRIAPLAIGGMVTTLGLALLINVFA